MSGQERGHNWSGRLVRAVMRVSDDGEVYVEQEPVELSGQRREYWRISSSSLEESVPAMYGGDVNGNEFEDTRRLQEAAVFGTFAHEMDAFMDILMRGQRGLVPYSFENKKGRVVEGEMERYVLQVPTISLDQQTHMISTLRKVGMSDRMPNVGLVANRLREVRRAYGVPDYLIRPGTMPLTDEWGMTSPEIRRQVLVGNVQTDEKIIRLMNSWVKAMNNKSGLGDMAVGGVAFREVLMIANLWFEDVVKGLQISVVPDSIVLVPSGEGFRLVVADVKTGQPSRTLIPGTNITIEDLQMGLQGMVVDATWKRWIGNYFKAVASGKYDEALSYLYTEDKRGNWLRKTAFAFSNTFKSPRVSAIESIGIRRFDGSRFTYEDKSYVLDYGFQALVIQVLQQLSQYLTQKSITSSW